MVQKRMNADSRIDQEELIDKKRQKIRDESEELGESSELLNINSKEWGKPSEELKLALGGKYHKKRR